MIGHHEIFRELGRGGGSVVHQARDLRLGRSAALEVLLRDKVADKDRRRVIREAKAPSGFSGSPMRSAAG